jgi:Xaa-Pro dipeptidase
VVLPSLQFVFFQCAILPLDPTQPTALLCRKPDVAQAGHLFDLCEIWINAVDSNPAEDLVQLLLKAGIAPGTATLGVETDTYGLTGRNHQLLLDALTASGHGPPRGPALKEASHIVRGLRMIKSPAEIEKMRMANELCDRAIMAGFEAARPGVLDSVVSGAAYNAMISGAETPFLLPQGLGACHSKGSFVKTGSGQTYR